ncbi:MAG: 2-phospho-L-lactate guanylyltransferase [Anaerolineaceae bacterium]|jgi:2-phospho-L-lactate guanylyltransferase
MTLWAIVPVKPLKRGKSRLAGVLGEDERTLLNFNMLGATLKTLSKVEEIDQVLVVSRDPSALALARDYNAKTVQEDGHPSLNMALKRAALAAKAYNADGIIILPADLPLLKPGDIKTFIKLGKKTPIVVIAPDRRKEGTNALLMRPAGVIPFIFGPGSFKKHLQAAEKAGVDSVICELETFGLDLDLPEDLELLKHMDTSSESNLFNPKKS